MSRTAPARVRNCPRAPLQRKASPLTRFSTRALALPAAALAVALGVAGCGARTSDDPEAAGTASSASCVDTSGDTVKIGFLNSLSGTMAISEQTVRDSLDLAAEEINADGGVLGKQLEIVAEDGASEPTVFAEKAEKLISSDCVAAVFGGWTSSSRKAMLPVFEAKDSLLFYPVQYEGLEASPNIFYTGATTNQQIMPGMDYLKEQGKTKIFLVGSDYVFPRTANKEIKAWAGGQRHGDRRRGVRPARPHRLRDDREQAQGRRAPTRCSTPSTATPTSRSSRSTRTSGLAADTHPGRLGVDRRGGGRRHRHRQHRRPAHGLELLPDDRQPGERRRSSRRSRPSTATTA